MPYIDGMTDTTPTPLPEMTARLEVDGWWVTIREGGQTRPPERMIQWMINCGYTEAAAADHVAAAIVRAGTPA
jgi:hypothetical protein